MSRSFESINYLLRPNKNVERKLIVATIAHLKPQFSIQDYRYVGFGSMWFADFTLMHKSVGINDMVTIEIEKSRQKRVEFNKPFGCISVRMDSAAAAIGDVVANRKTIVWLDYDGGLKEVLGGDIETAIGAMAPGSMFLVSTNARVDQLSGHLDDDGAVIAPAEYLADLCDDPSILARAAELTRVGFPELVRKLLHDRVKDAVLAVKPGCEYVPIWSFQYADNAEMVTVGGMITEQQDRERLSKSNLGQFDFLTPNQLFRIELPMLTEKEKRALDRLLPSISTIDPKQLDFELRLAEIEAYRRFYLQYPVFTELAL